MNLGELRRKMKVLSFYSDESDVVIFYESRVLSGNILLDFEEKLSKVEVEKGEKHWKIILS